MHIFDASLDPRPAPGRLCGAQSKEDQVLSTHVDAAPATQSGKSAHALPQNLTSEQLLARILESLEENKAEDTVQIDLRGKSSIGDFMVICSGRSSRQVASIAERLVETLKTDLGRQSKIEGKDAGDWVLIDTGDIIVHVFRPEVRDFYQLEKMWQPATTAASAQKSS